MFADETGKTVLVEGASLGFSLRSSSTSPKIEYEKQMNFSGKLVRGNIKSSKYFYWIANQAYPRRYFRLVAIYFVNRYKLNR